MGLYMLATFLNFLVNFFLLIGTNQIIGEHLNVKRSVVAAALGGVYAAVCLHIYVLGNTLWRLCAIGIMSKLAFGRCLGRQGLLFMILQLAVSGVAAGLHSSGLLSVIITAVGICVMFLAGIWDRRTKHIPVELSYGGKTVRVIALRDTGNTLQDPLTGQPVLVLGADAAKELTGLSPAQLRRPVDVLPKQPIPGLRLIPYHTIDTPEGLLLGVWIKEAKIGKRKAGTLVAFAPEKLSEDGSIQALTGGML